MRYLKQLQLQGYKTFASRTEFFFDAGITAIVGPNGSGKSNIADGLRWVLGEQSYGSLRGKRTEDMIFSGSDRRARMGMAFVSLTLDNSTGWLPIDYTEVELARRAYRTGENEYYINGARVRLREISELLASSGLAERTYTVIGQGLVDQALAQRPEGRRKLFEEAAGITIHQAKRAQATQRLKEAETNLTRAQDIISELTPRLRYLKGQARRAREYQQIKTDLQAQLRVWYGFRWHKALATLADAKDRLIEQNTSAEEQAEALRNLTDEINQRRAERAQLREQLGEWHRASSQLHRRAEAIQRELAVRSEQHRLWGEQREELQREIIHLRASLEDGQVRLAAAEAELAEARAAHDAHQSRVNQAQADLDQHERARQELVKRLNQAQDAVLSLKTRLADRQSRTNQAVERRAALIQTQMAEAEAVATAAAQLRDLASQLDALDRQAKAAEAELDQIDRERQTQAAALAAAQDLERQRTEALNAAARALSRLQDQHDMLARLRDEGAGLNAGPRTVLGARAQLPGIVGPLGELIEVPQALERAIEAALGGRLQDIVVRHWEDAEAAVDYLKRRQGGRATFLPLDSLRVNRPIDAPKAAGVLGRASDLVKFDPDIKAAVEQALGRILVVEDLPTAHRLLNSNRRATMVTVDGEIIRPGGSVTGGSYKSRRDDGLLARARTLRELPNRISAAAAKVASHEGAVAAAQHQQETVRAAIDALRTRRDELRVHRQQLASQQQRLELAVERARQAHAWHDERQQAAEQDLRGLDKQERDLNAAVAILTEQLAQQETAVTAIRRELAERATDDLVRELARMRAEAAVSTGQLQSYQARVEELRTRQAERRAEISAKEERIEALAAQQAGAGEAISDQGSAGQQLADEINALAAQIDPAEARLAELEKQQRDAESLERALREQLRQAQMHQSQAELMRHRAEDDVIHLKEEIEKDLGLVLLVDNDLFDTQPPLPLNGVATSLPKITELPDGFDQDVRNLRAQIGRLGSVNLDAIAEYAEVEARHNFLTSQSEDLKEAIASLEQVIAELDEVMEREFLATFKTVAALFREEFKSLFGGGSAKLVLTDPDNPGTTGVEIIARPPGKREQGLALLSGGERALTAAALLFSILKARPTPFCVLDEVDAALDEANVGRFRETLKALSQQTQFILITHNRGTIEVADTLYGISMGEDNTSITISLKLEGGEVVPAKAVDEE